MSFIYASLWYRFKVFGKIVMNTLFPLECVGCKKVGSVICFDCRKTIPKRLFYASVSRGEERTSLSFSGVYGYRNTVISKGMSRGKYAHSSKPFILLTEYALPEFQEFFKNISNAVIVPVPLHPVREHERGFNQSQVICNVLENNLGIKTCSLLTRIRNTPQQARLKKRERQSNLVNAFELNMRKLEDLPLSKDTPLVLVDDVISTGATIVECAQVLELYGFRNISALCLARGGR